MRQWLLAGMAAVLWCAPGPAQEIATPPAIPPLTPVRVMIVDTINSSTAKIGAHFLIKLAEPIAIDGKDIVPAGISGEGEVIHADKSRFGGKPGELILAVRYLDWNGTHIPLRSLKFDAPGQGKNNDGIAAASAIAAGAVGSMFAMFITGGEVNIPAGTIANAKVAAPPPAAAAATPVSTGEAVK
jgi:hypothetical protein